MAMMMRALVAERPVNGDVPLEEVQQEVKVCKPQYGFVSEYEAITVSGIIAAFSEKMRSKRADTFVPEGSGEVDAISWADAQALDKAIRDGYMSTGELMNRKRYLDVKQSRVLRVVGSWAQDVHGEERDKYLAYLERKHSQAVDIYPRMPVLIEGIAYLHQRALRMGQAFLQYKDSGRDPREPTVLHEKVTLVDDPRHPGKPAFEVDVAHTTWEYAIGNS